MRWATAGIIRKCGAAECAIGSRSEAYRVTEASVDNPVQTHGEGALESDGIFLEKRTQLA